jgi:hypothetical protein
MSDEAMLNGSVTFLREAIRNTATPDFYPDAAPFPSRSPRYTKHLGLAAHSDRFCCAGYLIRDRRAFFSDEEKLGRYIGRYKRVIGDALRWRSPALARRPSC